MRTSKAYIAGVGTTSVLVASALLLLAVVSALVAFRGWPSTGLTESIGNLVVDEPERLAVEPPVQVALNASAVAAAVAQAPASGSPAGGRPASDPGPGGAAGGLRIAPQGVANFRAREPTREPVEVVSPIVNPPSPKRTPSGLLPESPLTPTVVRLTDGLGDTTQGLTDNLGGTLGRLSPPLGQTVVDTGRALADLLRALGQPRR